MALRAEVVDLLRRDVADLVAQADAVGEVAVVQEQARTRRTLTGPSSDSRENGPRGTVLTTVTLGFWLLISWLFPLALWVLTIIFCVQGFNKAKDGVAYRYPMNIRLIK